MSHRLPVILLLAFTAIIFISTSFQPALLDDADSTHAEAAREMIERRDYVTLHVNGVRYLEKAPMIYWMVAGAFHLFGINQFAVRLPTALAIVALTWMIFIFGRWAYSEKTGLYAAAVIASCIGIFLFTRVMIPEAILTLWFTIGHYCFLRGFFGTGKEKNFYYGFYAAMALAVLTKGLIGIIFIAGPVFWFLLLTRNFSELKNMRIVTGVLLLLVIAAPWHLLAGYRNDRFLWFYFVNEHFKRFLGTREPKDYNRVPFLSYWLLHLIWLFPWSLGLPLGWPKHFTPFWKLLDRRTMINLYLWIQALCILIFFNLSTSQEYYTFPAYAPLALLLGAAFHSAQDSALGRRYLTLANGALAVIGLAAAAVLFTLVWQARHIQPTGDISSLLNMMASDSEQYTLALGHMFDLTTAAFAELRGPALGAAVALSVGFVLAWIFRWRGHHGRSIGTMMVAMGVLFVCANRAQIRFDPVLSSRGLAMEIEKRWEPGAQLVFNGEYETGSSIAFYTNRQILLLNGKVTGMAFGSTYPDAPPVFLSYDDVRRLWNGPQRIFLFTENSKRDTLLKNLNVPFHVLADKGGKSVLMNKP